MNDGTPRFYNSLLTVLILSSVISVKMAFLYAAEMLLVLLITIPAAALLYFDKSNDGNME